MNQRSIHIESLLFYLNEETSKKRIADLVGCNLEELEESLSEIKNDRASSGIVLVETNTTVAFATHPSSAQLIEHLTEAQRVAPLSQAALETLAVILYQSPVSRPEIDMVRGVNSLYSVRNLLVRGLVSRRTSEGRTVYEPTTETLRLLGVKNTQELPDFQEVIDKIKNVLQGSSQEGD